MSHGSNSQAIRKKKMQHLCTPHFRKEKKWTLLFSLENGQSHFRRSLVAILNTREPYKENVCLQGMEMFCGAFLSPQLA